MNEPHDLLTTAEVALILRAGLHGALLGARPTPGLRASAAADLMRSATSPGISADFFAD